MSQLLDIVFFFVALGSFPSLAVFFPLVIIHKSFSVRRRGRAAITQTLVSVAVAVQGVITTITMPL